MGKIELGMIVRYAPEWCSPSERSLLHVVKENVLNPTTGKMTRWVIETLNSNCFINPIETVDENMIEPTGFTVEDVVEGRI